MNRQSEVTWFADQTEACRGNYEINKQIYYIICCDRNAKIFYNASSKQCVKQTFNYYLRYKKSKAIHATILTDAL